MSLSCNLCGRELKPHCGEKNRCDWWTCSNTNCDAVRYDVRGGRLLHRDGSVERV